MHLEAAMVVPVPFPDPDDIRLCAAVSVYGSMIALIVTVLAAAAAIWATGVGGLLRWTFPVVLAVFHLEHALGGKQAPWSADMAQHGRRGRRREARGEVPAVHRRMRVD